MPVAAETFSPIAFVDSEGSQLSIPASALSFDDDGALMVDSAYAEAQGWLEQLLERGVIVPGTKPAPTPALKLSAVDEGSLGNVIELKVKDGADPDTFDVELSVVSEYPGLTLATAKARLGTPSQKPQQPGLLRIGSSGDLELPLDGFEGTLEDGSATDPSSLDIDGDPSGTAFSVQAFKAGEAGDAITVSVTRDGSRFDITAEWKAVLTGIEAGDLDALNEALGFLAEASAPAEGVPAGLPQAGDYRMSGGVDSSAASVLLLAK